MKVSIVLDLENVMKKPIDEWGKHEYEKMDKAKDVVKLEKEDAMLKPGDARPVKYTVKEGDTLKSVGERHGISYGEMTTHMMNTEGSTSIHKGQEIEIPRHYKDLSKAE